VCNYMKAISDEIGQSMGGEARKVLFNAIGPFFSNALQLTEWYLPASIGGNGVTSVVSVIDSVQCPHVGPPFIVFSFVLLEWRHNCLFLSH
jgi:hypothetical protein